MVAVPLPLPTFMIQRRPGPLADEVGLKLAQYRHDAEEHFA